MLVWPRPVTLGGLALLVNEFGSAEIQSYTGPETKHPRDASDADWQTVQTLGDAKAQSLSATDLQTVSFDSPITTRALRIRFTSTVGEGNNNARLSARARDGKRVALGEWMALQPLKGSALETALLPVEKPQNHAPIPIKFSLPDDGEVTLVIEDSSGKRVRNLVSQTPFPKGENTHLVGRHRRPGSRSRRSGAARAKPRSFRAPT